MAQLQELFYTAIDTNSSSVPAFVGGKKYVVRFLLDGWEKQLPPPEKRLILARRAAGVFAACGDCQVYDLHGVAFSHLPPGQVLNYMDAATWGTVTGIFHPWNAQLTSSDGTWFLDIVIAVKTGNSNLLGSIHYSCWESKLIAAIQGTAGAPLAHLVGVLPLDEPSLIANSDLNDWYTQISAFWSRTQPYWEYVQSAIVANTEYIPQQINAVQGANAWQFWPPYLGTGRAGFTEGSATEPVTLQARQASIPSVQPSTTPATVQPDLPVQVPNYVPPASAVAQASTQMSVLEKVGALGIGLVLALILASVVAGDSKSK